MCFVKLLITLAGDYKLELSEELGQRDEHHDAAAAVLLPHLLHQRGAGADGGDADGYRSNKDVDAAGASAWLVGSIDGTDLAGNVSTGEFIFICVSAIRLTSCFVYRRFARRFSERKWRSRSGSSPAEART